MPCLRCQAENVTTDQTGLCPACQNTDPLPGVDVTPVLTLTHPN